MGEAQWSTRRGVGHARHTMAHRPMDQSQRTSPGTPTNCPNGGDTGAPVIDGWTHVSRGKVRDLYVSASDDSLVLVVASDRISAFDYILPTPIPDKGRVLTQLSAWWFSQLDIAHHMVSLDVPEVVAGRAMICRRLSMIPIECVARGYLTGSGLAEYRASGAVCGTALPSGLTEGSELPHPIFTPAAKAEFGEHDENISFARTCALVGDDLAIELQRRTLDIYDHAQAVARERGIILADTKCEFGLDSDGHLTLGDEVLTPDSSRFWSADDWCVGAPTPSYDKQYVRDWLRSDASGWDGSSTPPPLPDDVVANTRARYLDAFERLTGTPLDAICSLS